MTPRLLEDPTDRARPANPKLALERIEALEIDAWPGIAPSKLFWAHVGEIGSVAAAAHRLGGERA